MSRHRLVRNLVEDDYYDDYDDYDDDYYEDDYDDTYAPPPKQKAAAPAPKKAPAAAPKQQTVAAKIAVPGKTAVTASVGVTKPPPGWGKPAAPDAKQHQSSGGITKAPPGWGAPTISPATKPKASVEGISPKRNKASRSKSPKPDKSAPYKPRPVPDFVQNSKSQLSMVILGCVLPLQE